MDGISQTKESSQQEEEVQSVQKSKLSLSDKIKTFLAKYGLISAIVLFGFFTAAMNPVFLSSRNLFNIMMQMTVLGSLAIGQTFVIISGGGGIDLSVGSVLAFSAAIGAGFIVYGGLPVSIGILITLLVGTVIGILNGLIVMKVKLPPLITTLAMMTAARGGVMIYTGGADILNLPSSYTALANEGLGPIRYAVILVVMMYIIGYVVLKHTKFGRQLYAVGGNEQAARVSGIDVKKMRIIAFAISGFCAAVAGFILTSRLYVAQPRAGQGMELTTIAAVVIGGTSLAGGRGKMSGTLLGVLLLTMINNATNLLGVPPSYVLTFRALIIFLAATLDRFRQEVI